MLEIHQNRQNFKFPETHSSPNQNRDRILGLKSMIIFFLGSWEVEIKENENWWIFYPA